MSKILKEKKLKFDFTLARDAIKFDDDRIPEMKFLKGVDFLIEWDHEIWFVEVKKPKNVKKMKRMKTKMHLQGKDSFLYLYLNDRIDKDKSLIYYVLIDKEDISKKSLTFLTEYLNRNVGLENKDMIKNKYIESASVFNEATWNKRFNSQCPVKRIT